MSKKYRKGIFALSADPVTNGHLSLIELALQQCEELIVLVANNDTKKEGYAFSLVERTQMVQRAVKLSGLNEQQVRVLPTTGLLTDVFVQEECDVIFRGLRHDHDRVNEQEQMALYTLIQPRVVNRFVFLETPHPYTHISSSWVKSFAHLQVDISPYVPLFVKQAIEERVCGQFKIGITGTLSVGKSTVARRLVAKFQEEGYEAHHIDIDTLLHEFYGEDSAAANTVRYELAQRFGQQVLSADHKEVNRPLLAQQLFSANSKPEIIHWAQQLVAPHVERIYRNSIRDLHGIILVEWAQLAEMQMQHWVNNNVIVVDSPNEKQFADKRGLTQEYIDGCKKFQWSVEQKITALQAAIHTDGSGKITRYINK
ncbi:MAG: dephospho-CoA kinase [Candidatus Kerfeldbacteria bacterium]|nr:dephospho-CoA kinase [Candidatus Kerfeldbacteria bacterium]